MTWPPEQLQPQQQPSDKETMRCANLSLAAYGLGPAGITLRETPRLSSLCACVSARVWVRMCVLVHATHDTGPEYCLEIEDIL